MFDWFARRFFGFARLAQGPVLGRVVVEARVTTAGERKKKDMNGNYSG